MYEIYALKVSEREVDSPILFSQTDYGKKSILVYYFWCLKGDGHTILVDTGISPDELRRRGITEGTDREELLTRIGVTAGDVDTIILSHLHSDHFADPLIYSKAIFYVQRKEVEFWSGEVKDSTQTVDISTLQKLDRDGRVRFLDGDSEIYPGVSTQCWGAHTPGLQVITVQTARGTVLLCVDFFHMYRNWEDQIPASATNLAEWMSGIKKIEGMGLPKDSVIPGHDSLLLTKFTKVAENVVKLA